MAEKIIVSSPDQLPWFLADSLDPLVVDVETTSFDDKLKAFDSFRGDRICGVAISTLERNRQDRKSWYIPIRHRGQGDNIDIHIAIKFLKAVLENGRDIVNHNIKFDVKFLWADKIWIKGRLIDTLTMARLCNNIMQSYELEDLQKSWLGADGKNIELSRVKAYLNDRKSKDYAVVPVSLLGYYAIEDTLATGDLYWYCFDNLPDITKQRKLWDTEISLTKKLAVVECRGVRVDKIAIQKAQLKCLKRILAINADFNNILGQEVNIGSWKTVAYIMENIIKAKPTKFTPTGRAKWDAKTLGAIKDQRAQDLAEYSKLSHFEGTYCSGLLERAYDIAQFDTRVHTTYNQAGTVSGRLSSSNPNLQNQNEESEEFWLAYLNHIWVSWDQSQIEYRIFAHYSDDESILSAYRNNPLVDYHQLLADKLGVDRHWAKTLNFAFLYGMGKKKLLANITDLILVGEATGSNIGKFAGLTTASAREAAANNIYSEYHKLFPSIRILRDKVWAAIGARGCIYNFFGRVFRYNDQNRSHGLNNLIQGSSADQMKKHIVQVCDKYVPDRPDASDDNTFMLNTVHDSLSLSMPETCADRQDIIRGVTQILQTSDFNVPLIAECKIGKTTWASCSSAPKETPITDFSIPA